MNTRIVLQNKMDVKTIILANKPRFGKNTKLLSKSLKAHVWQNYLESICQHILKADKNKRLCKFAKLIS